MILSQGKSKYKILSAPCGGAPTRVRRGHACHVKPERLYEQWNQEHLRYRRKVLSRQPRRAAFSAAHGVRAAQKRAAQGAAGARRHAYPALPDRERSGRVQPAVRGLLRAGERRLRRRAGGGTADRRRLAAGIRRRRTIGGGSFRRRRTSVSPLFSSPAANRFYGAT